jgi:hypothetical protein
VLIITLARDEYFVCVGAKFSAAPSQGRPWLEVGLRTKDLGAPRPVHLILQPVALLLLPALCNSILLVANNLRQLTNMIMVSFGSASTVNE